MKKIKFFVIAAAAMTMSACSESMLDLESVTPQPSQEEPVGFHIKDINLVDVVLTDNSLLENVEHPGFGVNAEDTIRKAGTEGIKAAEPLRKVAEETLTFAYNYDINNKVVVEGLTMQFIYEGKEYTIPCLDELTVSGSHEVIETSSEPAFYELSKTDYVLSYGELELAGDTQVFVVEEGYVPPTVDHVDCKDRHIAFVREAQLSNNNIVSVFCKHVAEFAQMMSDGSRQNEESVDFNVVHEFFVSVSEIRVTADDEIVGKTYYFVNGEADVNGSKVFARHLSSKVEGKVMYQGTDYAGELTTGEAAAQTITFVSTEEAVIRFYDEDREDYAQLTIRVSITPEVTVTDVARDYHHVIVRPQAVVANNTISVLCDNVAVQTTTMSDGTFSKVSTNYTWTNRFVYNIPVLPASVKGQTFRFNAGTADVVGYDVTVYLSSREVSAIMFDGTDYRSEAPVCEIVVTTITFGENSATITFEHDGETVSVTIPVKYIEAEIISGKIVGMWITDSYNLNCQYVSTDLHILAENNGAYVAYSRGVNGTDWTVTNLSAADGQSILSSGRAMAWAQPGRIGTVSAVKSSKDNTGYIITYYFPDGAAANIMGDAEAALNGNPFTDPVKATGSAENGMWTISYNGVVNYFVGTNM